MALKLKWKNPNKGATTVDIYRGDTSVVDLTTPLATVANGVLEYVDTTALFGKTYYYVWAVNTLTDRVVSRPQKIEVTDRRGPGSNVILHGNEDYGFFGRIASADFVNSATIMAACKSLVGMPTTLLYPTWYKFIRHGKVLFLPGQFFGEVIWNNLYNAGVVYGANNNGPAGTVNQLTTFTYNGDTFLIRCLDGFPDGLVWDGGATPTPDTLPGAEDNYSEYEDLLYPMLGGFCPLRQRMVVVGNEPFTNFWGWTNYSNAAAALSTPCRDTVGNFVLGRGRGYNYNAESPFRAMITSAFQRAKTATFYWLPVIELVGRTDEIDLSKL